MFALLDTWLENRARARNAREKAQIMKLKLLLERAPSGRGLIDFAEKSKIRIAFSNAEGGGAIFQGNAVKISRRAPAKLQPLWLAHELRHAWQQRQGLSMSRVLNIGDAILNTRFQEADAFSLEAQIAWELEQAGIKGTWRRYKREEKRLAEIFERAAFAMPAAVKTGLARRAAFNEWFRTPHRDSYDADIIDDCERQCENVVKGKRACVTFDRKRPAEAPQRMSVAYLREFGLLGEGNYLEGANTHAPLYTGPVSNENYKKIKRLCLKYDCIEPAGTAGIWTLSCAGPP